MVSETEHERDGLLPCVFCAGGAAVLVLVVQQIAGMPEADDVCFVRCGYCFAQGPAHRKEDVAIALWNKRVAV